MKKDTKFFDYGEEFEELYQGLEVRCAGDNKKMACYKMYLRAKKKFDKTYKPLLPEPPKCKIIIPNGSNFAEA